VETAANEGVHLIEKFPMDNSSWWDDGYETQSSPIELKVFEVDASVKQAKRVVFLIGQLPSTRMMGDTAIIGVPDALVRAPTSSGIVGELDSTRLLGV
jgi:hypothetical protein